MCTLFTKPELPKKLKENLYAPQEDKEAAVKAVVQRLTESYINEDMAVKIISEFVFALGWNIKLSENKHVSSPKIKSTNKTRIKPNERKQAKSLKNLAVKKTENKPSKSVVYTENKKGADFFGEYSYTGGILNKLMHVKGIIKWKTGDSYESAFVHSKISGLGKMAYKNGTVKVGRWSDDKLLSISSSEWKD